MPRPISCRSCGTDGPEIILRLGQMPLANAYLSREELARPEQRYPSDLAFCPSCSLIQITETVPPDVLFREYLYFSSYSDTVVRNAEEIVTRLIASRNLNGKSLAGEIASNDGYLLQFYKRAGIPVLGIEPAANIAKVAVHERDIPTLCDFFGADLARRLRDQGECVDVLHGNNVLAHVPDLNGVVSGIRLILKDSGMAVIEVPYVKEMIDRCEFDTIYQEHLCYFSLTALDRLFHRHDLVIEDVEHLPIHGGSLRLFVVPRHRPGNRPRVEATLKEESSWGVDKVGPYRSFAQRVDHLKATLLEVLGRAKGEAKRVAAYGAAAKGTVLLNYCGVGPETLEFVVDRSPHKQGRYVPGVRVLIQPPEKILETMPDYVLLLVWNIADEVLEQQSEYRRRGGKFIIPIPEVRIV
ncbi:MAG: class I SAM-dependent methyltransferase [Terriglobia bacterium]|jgi:SAM-dependent methyltransferase